MLQLTIATKSNSFLIFLFNIQIFHYILNIVIIKYIFLVESAFNLIKSVFLTISELKRYLSNERTHAYVSVQRKIIIVSFI